MTFVNSRRERYEVRDDDVEQVKGIEPSCSAWEADILPLNYTCTLPKNAYTIPHLAPICKGEFERMKS